MRLSDYAKKNGISYRTAWDHYKLGLIPNAKQLSSGIIVIEEESLNKPEKTAVYARVSSLENKDNLLSQSGKVQRFCAAKGWIVSVVVEEYGSRLNDNRKKLKQLLLDKHITRIVVEHKDVLTRFGFNYLKDLWHGEIVIINEAVEDKKDLMQDFISLVTSFSTKLYRKRRSRRKIEELIKQLSKEDEYTQST